MVAREVPPGARYHFVSRYVLRGSREVLWGALVDIGHWPLWWTWLKAVEVQRPAAGPDGSGARFRATVRAPAGYGLTFTLDVTGVDRLHRIDVVAGGDLEGRGRLLLSGTGEEDTELSFTWLVSTPKRWMVLLSPVARPAFAWNHDRMMTDFGAGLASAVGCGLLSSSSSSIRPGSPGFQEFDQ